MLCVDEIWFKKNYSGAHVATMNVPIKVRGIGSTEHPSHQYSVVKIYLPAKKEGVNVLIELLSEFHFVQGLGCHMLIGNDIMVPNGIILDLASKKLKVPSCSASADIQIRNRQSPVTNRKVRTSRRITVPPFSQRQIPVAFKDIDRELNFVPTYNATNAFLSSAGALLEAVVDSQTSIVLYHNKTSRPLIIPKGIVVGELMDFDNDSECHFTSIPGGEFEAERFDTDVSNSFK
jgi:hypothetical protein